MTASGLTIVGASAGSGKTFRLTKDVTDAVDPSAADPIEPESLVAVTYTRKAQAELGARIRQKLVASGAFDAAARLPLAYLGTVHAVSLRLVQELAMEAGLSPHVDVLAGDEGRALRESLERALSMSECGELDRLAARLELLWQPQVERFDWVRPVTDIMELARSNRIAPDELMPMADQSVSGLLALFPGPAGDARSLDARLATELDRAAHALDASRDMTKTTRLARALIEECRRRLADGELRWSHWAKLSRIETAKAASGLVEPLRAVAGEYVRHPALREDIAAMTRAIFAAARAGLMGYAAWKKERRVIDYVDMVACALDIVAHPRVAAELAERLRLVVVDEFQDTSPIQLALFMHLHKIAGRSIWVGDRKQCIFEYAGADPGLMDSVTAWGAASGARCDRLTANHRSRPELVDACSDLFSAALAPHGFAREEVVVSAARSPLLEQRSLEPFGLFVLDAANKKEDALLIARGVARLLERPAETPILDRLTGVARHLAARDVAVLVATNAEAAEIAAALHACGLRVALARAGLLGTPEGALGDAVLRLLLDPHDALSSAVIDALTGYEGRSPEAWLVDRLDRVASDRADEPGGGWRAAIARVRESIALLSPREALEEVLVAVDAVRLCARWPDPEQRIANLDALLAIATRYEARCAQAREAATVAGLLRHFDELRTPRLRREEMMASDDQHVTVDGDAVTVCTYHKAKGLEWPVVVLGSLDRTERRHAFEVSPESDADEHAFDPMQPLAGRWIRYWPWPFGALETAPLASAAEASPAGRRVAAREEKERLRLLYVGFTRARDHLVFAIRVTKDRPRAPWLERLCDTDGQPLLTLPCAADDGASADCIVGSDREKSSAKRAVRTRVYRLTVPSDAGTAIVQRSPRAPAWFARASEPMMRRAYWISPSRAAEQWPELSPRRVGRVERLVTAHPFHLDAKDAAWDALGIAVHGFLAADPRGLDPDERRARAARLLKGAAVTAVISIDSVLAAADALRAWVDARWPDARWSREVPIEVSIRSADGERRLSGVIDLLLETCDGRVVIDHKTFPAAAESAWRARAKEYVPQMSAYAEALEARGDAPLAGVWLHFALGGGMVEIVRG